MAMKSHSEMLSLYTTNAIFQPSFAALYNSSIEGKTYHVYELIYPGTIQTSEYSAGMAMAVAAPALSVGTSVPIVHVYVVIPTLAQASFRKARKSRCS
jgi:hypothetical protein